MRAVFDLPGARRKAFTLVEVMVSVAVLMMLMVLLLTITDQVTQIWRQNSDRTDTFREARAAFEALTRRLNQATLNTYYDVEKTGKKTVEQYYKRTSELRFISGPVRFLDLQGNPGLVSQGLFFQAPMGYTVDNRFRLFDNLLNTWGYFVERGSDKDYLPDFLGADKQKTRFRLIELMEPSEELSIYKYTSGEAGGIPNSDSYAAKDWYKNAVQDRVRTRMLAENIIALIVLPKKSKIEEEAEQNTGGAAVPLAPRYEYDSTSTLDKSQRNQLPPMVQVTMIAIAEKSAARAEQNGVADTLQNFLKSPALFSDSDENKYEADLKSVKDILEENNIVYRIFSTTVEIPGSKWTTENEATQIPTVQ